MNKVLVSICIAGTALAMSSCRSVEKAMPLSSINGEWNIIEVNGSKVTQAKAEPFLLLLFLILQPVVCPVIAAVIV